MRDDPASSGAPLTPSEIVLRLVTANAVMAVAWAGVILVPPPVSLPGREAPGAEYQGWIPVVAIGSACLGLGGLLWFALVVPSLSRAWQRRLAVVATVATQLAMLQLLLAFGS